MGRYTMEPGRNNPQGDLMGSWSVRDALTHKIVRNFPVNGRDKAEAWIHNGGFWQIGTKISEKAANFIRKNTPAATEPRIFESATVVVQDETKSVTKAEVKALTEKIMALEKETEAMMNRALDFGPVGQVSSLLAAKKALTTASANVSIFNMLSPWDAMKGGSE